MQYKASLDTLSKIITVFIGAIFITSIFHTFSQVKEGAESTAELITPVVIAALMSLVFVFCFLFSPVKYVVENGKVTVKRMLKDFSFNISDIKRVVPVTKESMKGTIRTFGNGGLFGYYGKYSNAVFGAMTWYATRRNNYVVFEMQNGKIIVLTPDNTGMADDISRQVKPS